MPLNKQNPPFGGFCLKKRIHLLGSAGLRWGDKTQKVLVLELAYFSPILRALPKA